MAINDTHLNLRLPSSLVSDLKKLKVNASEEVRRILEKVINKHKEENQKVLFCFCCEEIQESESDLQPVPLVTDYIKTEKEDFRSIVFVCNSCIDKISSKTTEEYQALLKSEGKENTKLLREAILNAIFFLPISKEAKEKTNQKINQRYNKIDDEFSCFFDCLCQLRRIEDTRGNSMPSILRVFEKMSKYYPFDYKLNKGMLLINNKTDNSDLFMNRIEQIQEDYAMKNRHIRRNDTE